MNSMTGYGFAELQNDELSVSAEIKGYNNRFLEIQVNIPSYLSPLEPPVREKVAAVCKRGSVEVSIRYRERNVPLSINVNKEALAAYDAAAREAAQTLGLSEKPSLRDLLQFEGVLDIERTNDTDRALERIRPVLDKAISQFCAQREREGEHTKRDIQNQLEILKKSYAVITANSAKMEEALKANVASRFKELLGDGVDEGRVLTETAALLVKYTISEEISRLASHFAECQTLIESAEPVGKKLDFLCQEINREINTIGSKASLVEISREVVPMKNALENMREQLRNVE
jgi:uncharacterized protein (TIGR00255 family)